MKSTAYLFEVRGEIEVMDFMGRGREELLFIMECNTEGEGGRRGMLGNITSNIEEPSMTQSGSKCWKVSTGRLVKETHRIIPSV